MLLVLADALTIHKLSGRISLAPLPIEQTTDIYVAHGIDGGTAAVQEPIDGQEDGDLLGMS